MTSPEATWLVSKETNSLNKPAFQFLYSSILWKWRCQPFVIWISRKNWNYRLDLPYWKIRNTALIEMDTNKILQHILKPLLTASYRGNKNEYSEFTEFNKSKIQFCDDWHEILKLSVRKINTFYKATVLSTPWLRLAYNMLLIISLVSIWYTVLQSSLSLESYNLDFARWYLIVIKSYKESIYFSKHARVAFRWQVCTWDCVEILRTYLNISIKLSLNIRTKQKSSNLLYFFSK